MNGKLLTAMLTTTLLAACGGDATPGSESTVEVPETFRVSFTTNEGLIEVEFVQEPEMSVSHGASLKSLVELGKEKGYELVSVLPYNAVFVRSEFFDLFNIENNAPEVLRKFHDYVTYIFSGYDGHVFVRGCTTTPWHKQRVRESKMQLLPKMLQRFPDNYSGPQRVLFKLCKLPDKLRQKFFG